jgi:hypothetical protein
MSPLNLPAAFDCVQNGLPNHPDAMTMWEDSLSRYLVANETVFVATDERSREWFKPLSDFGLHVVFFNDLPESAGLQHLLPEQVALVEAGE